MAAEDHDSFDSFEEAIEALETLAMLEETGALDALDDLDRAGVLDLLDASGVLDVLDESSADGMHGGMPGLASLKEGLGNLASVAKSKVASAGKGTADTVSTVAGKAKEDGAGLLAGIKGKLPFGNTGKGSTPDAKDAPGGNGEGDGKGKKGMFGSLADKAKGLVGKGKGQDDGKGKTGMFGSLADKAKGLVGKGKGQDDGKGKGQDDGKGKKGMFGNLAAKAKGMFGKGKGAAGAEGEGDEGKGRSLVDKLEKFARIIVAVPGLIVKVFTLLPMLWSSIWAFVMIMAVFAVLFVIGYIVYVTSPRSQLLWHSEDVEGYVSKFKDELIEAMTDIRKSYTAASPLLWRVPGLDMSQVEGLQANLEVVLGSGSLDDNLDSYLQFRTSLANSGNWLPRRDLRANARQFVDDEDEVDDLVKEYKNSFMRPLDHAASAARSLSGQFESRGPRLLRTQEVRKSQLLFDERGNTTADYTWYAAEASENSGMQDTCTLKISPKFTVLSRVPAMPEGGCDAPAEVVKYVTAVHKVRMMMEQRKAIERMYMSRRKNLPFAIWTLYYADLMNSLWFSFIAYWKKFPKRAVKAFMGTIGWWFSLGPAIAVMPCNMAFTDPEERSQKCQATIGEGFVSELPPDVDAEGNPRSEDARVDDVVESFISLGGIVKALSSIAAFFKNIGSIGEALAKLFMNFPTDPLGSILGLISIIIGMILGLILMLIWIMLTIGLLPLLLAFWWMWFSTITLGVLYTVWLVFLALLLAIPYFGLWLIDMPTNGFITRLMHCENSPGQWHSRNRLSDDNAYIRYFPFCTGPCGSRYTVSWSGCCCDRLPDYMPDLCPQQQIYNIATSGPLSGLGDLLGGPVAIAKYSPDGKFYNKSVAQKRKVLIGVLKKKVAWYQRCYDTLEDKDYLNKHLCAVFDKLGLTKTALTKLAVVCSECYCNYRRNDEIISEGAARMTDEGWQNDGNGGNESLCRDLKHQASGDSDDPSNQPGPKLLRKALLLSLVTLCALLALYSMAQSGNKLLA